jgi:predicted MFS family arabinose efflux permease
VVGPALGGLIYAAVGPSWCFVINGLSFIAVIIALLLMKLKPFIPVNTQNSAISDMKAGLKYVANHSAARMLITNLFVTTLFGLGITALIPAWSTTVLSGDATTNGFLLAARGFGSLVAALMIASLGRFRWRGKLSSANSLLLPISMIVFAVMTWLIPSLIAMAIMGFSFMVIVNLSNAMVQTRIADEMRGRVMGVYTFFFFGAMPVGSLLAGWSAEAIGEPLTVAISAAILLVFALWVFWRQPAMRQME